jgi:ATP-dependent Clp protease protease subunit
VTAVPELLRAKPSKIYWNVEQSRADDGSNAGELYIYGTIYDEKCWGDEYTPKELISDLNKLGSVSELNVHIFSNGGDVFAGNAIYTLLKSRKETVNIYIDGIAASIASVVAMAGDNIYIASNAMFMIHNPMLFMFGMYNKIDLERRIVDLNRVRHVTMQSYTDRTGIPQDQIHEMLDANGGDGTWIDAPTAIELGFADYLTPDAKAPLDAVAMIKPNIYASRGYEIDFTMYKNAPQLTTAARKEGKVMATTKRPKAARQRGKIVNELLGLECPHCHKMLEFDTDTETVSINPAEDATVAVPLEAQAKHVSGNFKNELYKVSCPSCGGEFDFETDPSGGEVIPNGGGADAPIVQGRRKTTAKRTAKVNAKTTLRYHAEVVPLTCTECGTEFDVDFDPQIDDATVSCPNCGAELSVDTSNVGSGDDGNADGTSKPDEPDIIAYRQGITDERKRCMALDKRAAAYPQYADAIDNFKRNGTSVNCANDWIFTALAANPQQGNGGYQAAARRDAHVVSSMGTPARIQNQKSREQEAFNLAMEKAQGRTPGGADGVQQLAAALSALMNGKGAR